MQTEQTTYSRCGRLILATTVLGTVLLGTSVANADTSSPGKNSASASIDGPTLLDGETLTVEIEKGKRKRQLLVFGSVGCENSKSFDPAGVRAFSGLVKANGVELAPTPGAGVAFGTECNSGSLADTFLCSSSGNWWLDLDAAEAANPGVFKNQSITIEMRANCAGQGSDMPMNGVASLSVIMQKK